MSSIYSLCPIFMDPYNIKENRSTIYREKPHKFCFQQKNEDKIKTFSLYDVHIYNTSQTHICQIVLSAPTIIPWRIPGRMNNSDSLVCVNHDNYDIWLLTHALGQTFPMVSLSLSLATENMVHMTLLWQCFSNFIRSYPSPGDCLRVDSDSVSLR